VSSRPSDNTSGWSVAVVVLDEHGRCAIDEVIYGLDDEPSRRYTLSDVLRQRPG
jgi:hypothetical protein